METYARSNVSVSSEAPHFGDLIRRLRSISLLSQEELAERVGVTRQRISHWERLAGPRLHDRNFRQLATALGMKPQVLQSLATGKSKLYDGELPVPQEFVPLPPEAEDAFFKGAESRTREQLERRIHALVGALSDAALITLFEVARAEMIRDIRSGYAPPITEKRNPTAKFGIDRIDIPLDDDDDDRATPTKPRPRGRAGPTGTS